MTFESNCKFESIKYLNLMETQVLSRGDWIVPAGISLVGLVVGYMVAASGTPVVSTVLPLVFGLVTVSFPLLTIWKSDGESSSSSKRIETAKQLAGLTAIFFVVFFSIGIFGGQWHKRYYAQVDLANLTSEKLPQQYTTAQKWFSTAAYLQSVGASKEVKDVFYDLLLKQEMAIIELQKKSQATEKNEMVKPQLQEGTPFIGWEQWNPKFEVPDAISPLDIPITDFMESITPKLSPLEKRRLDTLIAPYAK